MFLCACKELPAEVPCEIADVLVETFWVGEREEGVVVEFVS